METKDQDNSNGNEIPDLFVLRRVLLKDMEHLLQCQEEALVARLSETLRTQTYSSGRSLSKPSFDYKTTLSSRPRQRITSWEEEDASRKERAKTVSTPSLQERNEEDGDQSQDARDFTVRGPTSLLRRVVTSNHFETLFSFAIIANTAFLGFEVEYAARYRNNMSTDSLWLFEQGRRLFVSIFTIELAMRFMVHKSRFFCNSDAGWNVFDILLVAISVFDAATAHLDLHFEGSGNLTYIRMIRILRIVRVFRVFRLMRFFRSLRILVYSVLNTLKSLFWTLCLLMMILFLFSVIMTQGAVEFIMDDTSGADVAELERYYRTMTTSALTLFKTITGGVSWQDSLEPLKVHLHGFYMFLYVLYVAFMFFAVLNVVTGVFCEAAIAEAEGEKEEAVKRQMDSKTKLVGQLESLFSDMDCGSRGYITLEEFEKSLDDERLKAYFASLDLNVSDAWSLFKLLDLDGSDMVDICEFVSGCLRLIGNAKSVDIAMLSYESRWMTERFCSFVQIMEAQQERLHEELRRRMPLEQRKPKVKMLTEDGEEAPAAFRVHMTL